MPPSATITARQPESATMAFPPNPDDVENICANELRQLMTSRGEGAYVLVDVRQPQEYAGNHLPGALLLPLSEFEQRLEELWRLREKEVVFYCETGNRSRLAATLATAGLELPHVYNLVGGLRAWQGRAIDGLPPLRAFDTSGDESALLVRAIDLEKGAHRMYEALAAEFEGTEVAPVLEELLSAEVVHGQVLHRALCEISRDPVEDFDEMFARLPGKLLESGESLAAVTERARAQGHAGRIALLELALELECRAHDLYKTLANQTASAGTRDVLAELAQHEKRHAEGLLSKLGAFAARSARTA
jgi:rhodanese-related sulfurtransferase/rubrerythrin